VDEQPAHQWHEDGHKVRFRWNADQVEISYVECPFAGTTGLCNLRRDHCVVDTFVGVYGSEVNIGSCDINGPQEIAWVALPGGSDLDNEFSQIWIVPLSDEDYKMYKARLPRTKEDEATLDV
jgi:hypothetical protein